MVRSHRIVDDSFRPCNTRFEVCRQRMYEESTCFLGAVRVGLSHVLQYPLYMRIELRAWRLSFSVCVVVRQVILRGDGCD